MCSCVAVPFLVSLIFLNKVQVISADDDGSIHLCGFDTAGENASSDGDIPSEGALVVDIVTLNSFLGSLEAHSHRLKPSITSFSRSLPGLFGHSLVSAVRRGWQVLVHGRTR